MLSSTGQQKKGMLKNLFLIMGVSALAACGGQTILEGEALSEGGDTSTESSTEAGTNTGSGNETNTEEGGVVTHTTAMGPSYLEGKNTVPTGIVDRVSVDVDNPFHNAKYYIDPVWSDKAAAEPGGEAIAYYNTAVWMDRTGAITDGIGLRGHLDNAVKQDANMFMFVVYNLPNRDCAALASNGELRIAEDGFRKYKDEYIQPIVDIISDDSYKDIRIVAIIEVDSLPNLVTNLDEPDCAEADGPGGYKDGVRHALNALAEVPNVYSYVDVAHSGWLGWDSNFGPAVELIADVVKSTDKGWDSIAGFITNSANYTPTDEVFLTDPTENFGGYPLRSADYFEWNFYFDEKSYAQDWRQAMIQQGAPTSIGMLIDTSRNGWGGGERPTEKSQSSNLNTFVDESRVDQREHRGNWCNQAGGIGYKPWPNPYPGIDAFVWVKPPGESDGISDPNFAQDPNDPNKKHDAMCDPAANNRYSKTGAKTGSMADAPHAGRWFSEQFQVLLENAYPPATSPAGPPLPPPPPPSDCPGLEQNNPINLSAKNQDVELDLRCGAIYVKFPEAITGLQFDNTGAPFSVTITWNGQSKTNQEGYSWGSGVSGSVGTMKVESANGSNSVKIRWY